MTGLKVGDRVKVATGFGMGPVLEVEILGLWLVEPGEKDGGERVQGVTADELEAGRVIVDYFANGHPRWARGSQVLGFAEGVTA